MVTIVILIILATISINIVLNGGLIEKAQQGKELYENATANEERMMQELAEYANTLLNGTNIEDEEEIPTDGSLKFIGEGTATLSESNMLTVKARASDDSNQKLTYTLYYGTTENYEQKPIVLKDVTSGEEVSMQAQLGSFDYYYWKIKVKNEDKMVAEGSSGAEGTYCTAEMKACTGPFIYREQIKDRR